MEVLRMSYLCRLEDGNKDEFINLICNIRVTSYCTACIYLVWLFEFICALQVINTKQSIDFKYVKKFMNFDRESIAIMNILYSIRNTLTHTPFLYDSILHIIIPCINIVNDTNSTSYIFNAFGDKAILARDNFIASLTIIKNHCKINIVKGTSNNSICARDNEDIDNLY